MSKICALRAVRPSTSLRSDVAQLSHVMTLPSPRVVEPEADVSDLPTIHEVTTGFVLEAFELERKGSVRSPCVAPPQPDTHREIAAPYVVFIELKLGRADRLYDANEKQPWAGEIYVELCRPRFQGPRPTIREKPSTTQSRDRRLSAGLPTCPSRHGTPRRITRGKNVGNWRIPCDAPRYRRPK